MISPRQCSLFAVAVFGVFLASCDRRTLFEPGGPGANFNSTSTSPGVALVRNGPSLNSEATVEGSIQMMLGDNTTLDGKSRITGDLLVPGTPTLRLNGSSSYGGTVNGSGSVLPTGYKITLNGKARFGKLIRRTDPIPLQSVAAPTSPAGTRNVTVSRSNDAVGSWATVRNLTVNEKCGTITMPAGAYGNLTVKGNSTVRLGVAGATQPAAYSFQRITLNGDAELQVVGPVIVTVASVAELNSGALVGASGHPEWLDLKIFDGRLTLNGDADLYGYVAAPTSRVTINSDARLVGGLQADELTINGDGLLSLRTRVIVPLAADISVSQFERVDGDTHFPGPDFGSVNAGSIQTYSATVSSPTNSLNAAVTCSATVTGVNVGAYQLVWLTQAFPLAAGATQTCRFTLVLPNPGMVTVTVTATSAGDPNPANNTATGTVLVKAVAPPGVTTDLVVRSILPIAPVIAGTEVEYTAAIGVLQGGTNTTANFTCTVTATRASGNAPAGGGLVTIASTGTASTTTDGACRFKLTALTDNSGQDESYLIKVTATPADANELNATNNVLTANQVVKPRTIDLFVRSIQRDDNGLQPIAPVVGGIPEVVYVASIGANAGTATVGAFNCVVTATRQSTNAAGGGLVTLITSGTASTTADGECRFKLTQLVENAGQNEIYRITVTVNATDATDVAPANSLTVNQVVLPKQIDVFVRSLERDTDGNGTMGPVDSIPSSAVGHYVAMIGVTPGVGNQTSSPVSCTVRVVNIRTGLTVLPNPVTTVNGAASVTSDAICRFDLSLIGNGDSDERYRIEVTAQPSNGTDIGPGLNTLTANQLAIVRVDVSVDPITMTVDGVTADPTTIKQGKTGVYHALVRNNSSRTAQVRCDVTVSGIPFVFAPGTNVFSLLAGATHDCTFSVSFPNLVVMNVVVVASALAPLDQNLGNNMRSVTTTPVGNGKFIGVADAVVTATETQTVNPDGTIELGAQPQSMSVTNLALFVTDATIPIGYFKLVGSASSGGVQFSKDSTGGPLDVDPRGIPLNPGTFLAPSCIQQNRTSPLFRNNHSVDLMICAQPIAGDPGRQAITVSYSSHKVGLVPASANPVFFGNTVTIDIRLSWALAGSPVGVTDFAAATVDFDLQSAGANKKIASGCFRVTSAGETVLGGGASCP